MKVFSKRFHSNLASSLFASLLFATMLITLMWFMGKGRLVISASSNYISRDKTVSIKIYRRFLFLKERVFDFDFDIDKANAVHIIRRDNILYIRQVDNISGNINIKIKFRDKETFIRLYSVMATSDSDSDGIPDSVELDSKSDKDAFVNWFCSIASSVYFRAPDRWYKVHRDCSGLVAFCFKEALKKHTMEWMNNYPYLDNISFPDVGKYNYPDVPLLKDRVFRTNAGTFHIGDEDKAFCKIANATTLVNYNSVFLGKDIGVLQRGDLLAFYREGNYDMPAHIMIYIGGSKRYLIYHTGPGENTNGVVKRITINDLMHHPQPIWHPVADNKAFLGCFRFKILVN